MLMNQPAEIRVAPIASERSWMTGLAIAFAFLAPFVFYFGTARSIVSVWNSSDTFAHGYIILPISLWLIWRRRENFIRTPPQPFWPALGLLLAIGFGWLFARFGEVQFVMQYAFAVMLPVIALLMFGRRLAWSLAFPLLFVILAVPFGEIFIEPLIAYTADFTVWALQVTGIPVLRNGNRFEIPSGSWSVVDACSGVRYLISSITLGSLYAYITYRSNARRALFIVISIVVPIVANWLRAYMIVMIGHLSSMTLAVGFDHLIYGWLFFGVVMFLMFWIGSYWREDDNVADGSSIPFSQGSQPSVATRGGTPASMIGAMVAVVIATGIWPLLAHYSDQLTFNHQPVRIGKPVIQWPVAPSFSAWEPRYAHPDGQFDAVFTAPAGTAGMAETARAAQPVHLSYLYYRNQRNGKSLISSTNHLTGEKDAIHTIQSSVRTEQVGTRTLAIRESTLQNGSETILVWTWYWIDGQYLASDYRGKLLQAQAKLKLHNDDGAALFLSTPISSSAEQARLALRSFISANLAAIDAHLQAVRGG